jgi:hypothetical protein
MTNKLCYLTTVLSSVNSYFSKRNGTLPKDMDKNDLAECDIESLEIMGHILSIIVLCLCETLCGKPKASNMSLLNRCMFFLRYTLSVLGLSADLSLTILTINLQAELPPVNPDKSYRTSGLGSLSWICCFIVMTRSQSRIGIALWSIIEITTQAPGFWTWFARATHNGNIETSIFIASICSITCRLCLFSTMMVSPGNARELQQRDSEESRDISTSDSGMRRGHDQLPYLAQITFSWISPLLTTARQRALNHSDIFSLPSYADPLVVSDEFWQLWTCFSTCKGGKERWAAGKVEDRFSFVIWKMWGPALAQLLGLRLVCDFLTLSSAIILQLLLQHVAEAAEGDEYRSVGYIYTAAMLLFLTAGSCMSAQFLLSLCVEEQRVCIALSTAVMRTVVMHVPGYVAAARQALIAGCLDEARKAAAALPAAIDLISLPIVAAATLFLLFRLLEVPCARPVSSRRVEVHRPEKQAARRAHGPTRMRFCGGRCVCSSCLCGPVPCQSTWQLRVGGAARRAFWRCPPTRSCQVDACSSCALPAAAITAVAAAAVAAAAAAARCPAALFRLETSEAVSRLRTWHGVQRTSLPPHAPPAPTLPAARSLWGHQILLFRV